ncbi:MAG: CDP-diacylglycerol--glycerol-3-phosphate 3-phosphatidyltransferase [Clostridia bacterium]|nr:CDP-diacylglycerol--glycerol-3-phosphate 3-phosphatidyltransferase [Clostridia bacterium]
MTPNQITMIRIYLIPIMVFFYLADFVPYGKAIAVGIFAIAALTDFIDGKVARKTGQITELGTFLDSIADKMLIMSGLILIVADATVLAPWGAILAIIILAREFLVSGLRQVAATKKIIMSADKWGKYKAFLQDLAIPAFMLLAFFSQYNLLSGTFEILFVFICYLLIFSATILTLISGINYFIKNWSVFKREK